MSPEGDHPRFPGDHRRQARQPARIGLPLCRDHRRCGGQGRAKGRPPLPPKLKFKDVTPDGLSFDGDACSLTVRTVSGDVGILAGHLDLVSALGMGRGGDGGDPICRLHWGDAIGAEGLGDAGCHDL